jgi:hypothetical protein
MMAGLLDGLTTIQLIMKEQGCTWEEARRLWNISLEVEAENAPPPSAVIIPFPLDRVH